MNGKKKVSVEKVKKVKMVNVVYGTGDTNFGELVGLTLAEAREFLVSGNFNYPNNVVVSISGKTRTPKPEYKLKAGDELLVNDPEPVNVYFEKKTRSSVDFVGMTVAAVAEVVRKKWKSLPEKLAFKVGEDTVEADHFLASGEELTLGWPAVHVVCGSNGEDHSDLIGKTVAYARKALAETHNIKKQMKAIVNGDDIEDEKSHVLQQGDELEFTEEDGRLG